MALNGPLASNLFFSVHYDRTVTKGALASVKRQFSLFEYFAIAPLAQPSVAPMARCTRAPEPTPHPFEGKSLFFVLLSICKLTHGLISHAANMYVVRSIFN